ncbi:MAG: beta-propeller fold lactonase family protein [Lachnospiraceae bacterium]
MTKKYAAYVGTYTREKGVGIHVYDVDGYSLKEKNVVSVHNPTDLCVSADGQYLYSIADEGVVSFIIEEDGDLTYLNQQWTGGMRGCFLTVDKANRFLFMAGNYDGTVTTLNLREDGSIGEVTDTIYHKGLNIAAAQRGSKPEVNCVCLTPDERYLCAVDSGLDQIHVYEIDYYHGKLIEGTIIRGHLDSAPCNLVFSQDYRFAYVLCELKRCVDVYEVTRQEELPEFELIQSVSTVEQEDGKYCSASSFKLSANGKLMICSNSGSNSVAIFQVDQDCGALRDICNMKISGNYPKTLGIYPDGEHFVTLNQESNEMVTFHLNQEGKYFLMDGKPVPVDNPNCILFCELRS